MGRPSKESLAAKAAEMAAAGRIPFGTALPQEGETTEQAGEALQEGEKPAEAPAGVCFIESRQRATYFGSDGNVALELQRGRFPIEGAELERARLLCPELVKDG